jgi:hypothetical protein
MNSRRIPLTYATGVHVFIRATYAQLMYFGARPRPAAQAVLCHSASALLLDRGLWRGASLKLNI